MHRESKPILYALIVAYKNGIINKKPLKKWTDRQRVFKIIIKYVTYIVLFSHLIILTNEGLIIDLDKKLHVFNYLIDAYRLLNVIFLLPILLSAIKVFQYINRVYYVWRMMKTYRYQPNDIQAIDRITYKIKI